MAIPLRKVLRMFYPEWPWARNPPKNGAPLRWKRSILSLVLVLVLLKAGLCFFYYNTLLSLQYDVEEAKAQIDTQLQRRKNVVLNLGHMVREYARHEREIFKHATDSRKGIMPEAPEGLDALLLKVFAVAERYPDLRLSANFQRFMDALTDAENKIAEQRMVYNRRANEMSTTVGKFPGFIFARLFGFVAPPFFQPEAEARQSPKYGSDAIAR